MVCLTVKMPRISEHKKYIWLWEDTSISWNYNFVQRMISTVVRSTSGKPGYFSCIESCWNRPLKHCSLTIVVTICTFKYLHQICTFHASDLWMFIENSVKIIHSYQIFFLLVLKLLQPDNSNKRYREWKQCLIYYIFK